MAKSRKFVLVICEGPTDENALYRIFKSFFSPCEIRFHISHGDPLIINREDKNPMARIRAMVQEEKKRYALRDSDIAAVIQITDTDGAFIPDERITETDISNRIIYMEDEIRTKFPDSIISRNRKKRSNVNKLLNHYGINDEIPYRLYYVSRNLEHALYGIDGNLNDSRKGNLADDFSDEFGRDWRRFLAYIEKECSPLGASYEESWALIEKGTASLERHTNLNQMFEEFSFLFYGKL